MFGMALRTYQRRVQAISESLSDRDRTLWEAVLDYIGVNEGRSRKEVLHRFRWDDVGAVKAVLHDLVNSGLIYSLKQGGLTLYRVTPESDLKHLASRVKGDSLSSIVWVHIYRHPNLTVNEIAQALHVDASEVELAIDKLIKESRLELSQIREESPSGHDAVVDKQVRYCANNCYLPVGETIGWAASVYDHFQAMAKAISLTS